MIKCTSQVQYIDSVTTARPGHIAVDDQMAICIIGKDGSRYKLFWSCYVWFWNKYSSEQITVHGIKNTLLYQVSTDGRKRYGHRSNITGWCHRFWSQEKEHKRRIY